MTHSPVRSSSAHYASAATCEIPQWRHGARSTYIYVGIIASYTPHASRSSRRAMSDGIAYRGEMTALARSVCGMGLRDRLRDALALPYIAHHGYDSVPLESPWASPNHLVAVDAPAPVGGMDRTTAMSVPTVARARRIIDGSITRCPLEARVGGRRADEQPIWLNRTDGVQSPHFRMTWTIDDLFFYGWSLWALDRDTDGRVIRADRVPYDLWDVDADGTVVVNGNRAPAESVCLIPGIDEGLLKTSAAAIRHASQLSRLAERAARNPNAQIDLHQTSGPPLTREQARELIDSWTAARRGENGGVAYTSETIEARELSKSEPELLIEGRNHAAVDLARACGVPAPLVDAYIAGTGHVTYENQNTRNAELIDYALAPYMAAIAARLGLDDMVPRGWAVSFDLTDLTSPTIGDLDVPDDDRRAPAADGHTSIEREDVNGNERL